MDDLQSRFADNRMDDTMLVQCTCADTDHIMIWQMDSRFFDSDFLEQYPPEFYVDVHLSTWKGFWCRLWVGIKYIFGHKSRYGDFGGCSLNIKDADRIMEFLERYKNNCQKWYLNKQQIPLFNMREIEKQSNLARFKEK